MSDKELQELKEDFEEVKKKLTIAENDLSKAQKIIKDEFKITTIKEAVKLQEKLSKEIDELEEQKKELIDAVRQKLSEIDSDE